MVIYIHPIFCVANFFMLAGLSRFLIADDKRYTNSSTEASLAMIWLSGFSSQTVAYFEQVTTRK